MTYGSLCVITALEFFQHHFAKSGHRDLLMTRQLISTNGQPLLRPSHAKRPPQSGFVRSRLTGKVGISTGILDDSKPAWTYFQVCRGSPRIVHLRAGRASKARISVQLPSNSRAGISGQRSRKRHQMRHLRIFDFLVRDQEVDGSNPFAPTNLIPALPIIYAAISTALACRIFGTFGTTDTGRVNPTPTLSASCFLQSFSFSTFT